MKLRSVLPLVVVAVCATAFLAPTASAASRPARIVGGVPAAIDTAPWTAFLVAPGRSGPSGQFCGATVVSPTAVVTAAHCVVESGIRNPDVVTGQTTLSGSSGQRLQVAGIDVDPGYTLGRTGHDAAVVHLASPTAAPPIPIATPDHADLAAPGASLLLTGWGLVANNDRATPDALQQAAITAASNRRCRADSGGPLVSIAAGTPTLVGIVSFGGQHCGSPSFPGVYTRVSFEAGFLARALGSTPAVPTSSPAPGSQIGQSYGTLNVRTRRP